MSKPLGIKYCKDLAKMRGGGCLSSFYKDLYHKLKWKCSDGHIWIASTASIKNHWCPICNNSIGENINIKNNLIIPFSNI